MRIHPRIRGIIEHLERARTYERQALSASSRQVAFRMWMAAIYSIRAVVEIVRSAAKRGELSVTSSRVDQLLSQRLPRFRLVHRLRIDDFHGPGLLGPGHVSLDHRVKLSPYGAASIGLNVDADNPGLELSVSPGGSIKFFLISGLLVQDEREPRPVPLPELVHEQCDQIGASLGVFAALFRPTA